MKKNKKLATLTLAENSAWETAFTYALHELHYGPARADGYAWRDLCKQFPRLRAFEGCRALCSEGVKRKAVKQ